jgi:sulfate permease, SulP family
LFFGAAEKALSSLHIVDAKVRVLIIDMSDVPSMDATAIVALHNLIDDINRKGISMIMVGLPTRIIIKLQRAGIEKLPKKLTYCRNMKQATATALRWIKN